MFRLRCCTTQDAALARRHGQSRCQDDRLAQLAVLPAPPEIGDNPRPTLPHSRKLVTRLAQG
jgi:hypothetical protein